MLLTLLWNLFHPRRTKNGHKTNTLSKWQPNALYDDKQHDAKQLKGAKVVVHFPIKHKWLPGGPWAEAPPQQCSSRTMKDYLDQPGRLLGQEVTGSIEDLTKTTLLLSNQNQICSLSSYDQPAVQPTIQDDYREVAVQDHKGSKVYNKNCNALHILCSYFFSTT